MSSDVHFTDFKSDTRPTWCPGCGDFGTMNGMMKALANTGHDPADTFIVAGIGCSGKIGSYMRSYALHGVHGRALPLGIGVKLANPDLEVMVAGGDGDGYSIGVGHFVHAVRRNVDMTYVVMDNRIYGLTKGQFSPTSRSDFETSTSPDGTGQAPVQPLSLAYSAGATFLGQTFASHAQRHQETIEAAIEHDGFALVNVYSPCVTFNDVDTYDYFRDSLIDLQDEGHDPTDQARAEEKLLDFDTTYEGILYQDPDSVPYEQRHGVSDPMIEASERVTAELDDLLDEFA